mgnify:CR=1 FL=1
MMRSDPGRRRALYLQVATLVAGNPVADAIGALADNLAQAAGFASESPAAAEALLRSLVDDMARHVRDGWPVILEAKARARTLNRVTRGDA